MAIIRCLPWRCRLQSGWKFRHCRGGLSRIGLVPPSECYAKITDFDFVSTVVANADLAPVPPFSRAAGSSRCRPLWPSIRFDCPGGARQVTPLASILRAGRARSCVQRTARRPDSFASVSVRRDSKYLSGSDKMSVERIVIELETPGDSRSLFRLRLDNKVVGENLTAVQAHLLVGEILDRITLPRSSAMN
jgi:hypothetical protein